MSQRYTFEDDSGDVRLSGFLDPDPADAAALTGKVIPVANASGVTVDTTTYNDTIKGSGKLTTLVFPADQGALAIAITGDAFPRWIFAADTGTFGLLLGDGTTSLTARAASLAVGGADFNVGTFGTGAGPTTIGGGSGTSITCGSGTALNEVQITSVKTGFFGANPVSKPTVAGAKLPSDVVLASLLTALVALGLVTDNST